MASQTIAQNFSSFEFIEKLKSNDAESIETLVCAYTRDILKACMAMGFKQDVANDIVQETWVAFIESVPRFQGNSHIRTYLFGILYNKVREKKRDLRRYKATDFFEEMMGDRFDEAGHWKKSSVSPEKIMENTQVLKIIEDCLENLPVQQRMSFYLKEVVQEKTEQISEVLQVTANNIGVLLYRAKNGLRDCVEKKSL